MTFDNYMFWKQLVLTTKIDGLLASNGLWVYWLRNSFRSPIFGIHLGMELLVQG